MREFRDANGTEWIAFLTTRSVARDQHLPEEYREGWLAFESTGGEKRRLAPVPTDWESLTDDELSVLCARATSQVPRKKVAPSTAQVEDRDSAQAESADALQPQLHGLETRLSSTLREVCELPRRKKLNTGELIRVEETLAIAAETAKEAVSLRRKLRAGRDRKAREGTDSRRLPNDRDVGP